MPHSPRNLGPTSRQPEESAPDRGVYDLIDLVGRAGLVAVALLWLGHWLS